MSSSGIYHRDAGHVILREVGLRDGLQLTKEFPSTTGKTEWLNSAINAGIRHFELGSFLPKDRYPQFVDTNDLIEWVASHKGVFSSALAMNHRGMLDAGRSNVDEIVCVVSSTEAHSLANMRCSIDESIDLIRLADTLRPASQPGFSILAAIPMAFGCSISGEVSSSHVIQLAERCLQAGADAVSIADTVGFAGPRQIVAVSTELVKAFPDASIILHLHDTRGLAIANAAAALDAGIEILDGSLAGLGGCPFAPGATGNIVLEDLVFLCERLGFRTGVDIDALVEARDILSRDMPAEALFGAIARSGTPPNIAWQT